MKDKSLKTPITWVFILVTIVYNYDIFLVFFDDIIVEEKIKIIDDILDYEKTFLDVFFPFFISFGLLIINSFVSVFTEKKEFNRTN